MQQGAAIGGHDVTQDHLSSRRSGLASIRPSIGPGEEALSLADQIATQIAEAIINEDYAPGERIHEVAVSERYQVSRGPVREALRILENAGLVTILPRRGAIVTKLTVEEVQDVFEIRAVLVALAARRLAIERPADTLAQVDRRIAELRRLAASDGEDAPRAYVAISQELSFLICAGTGSERLTSIVYSLFHQTLRYTRLGLSTKARRIESSQTWTALLDAIRNGTPEAAETVAKALVHGSSDMAVRQLRAGKA
ncbi:MAG: GntR family transcriptional regulator [Pararhodobacter sp.]|nr:GntR family transcriptional regulator [Pararhodobacter sp.]